MPTYKVFSTLSNTLIDILCDSFIMKSQKFYKRPIFEKLSNDEKYKNVQFIKVDVDELQDVSSDAGIRAMPT